MNTSSNPLDLRWTKASSSQRRQLQADGTPVPGGSGPGAELAGPQRSAVPADIRTPDRTATGADEGVAEQAPVAVSPGDYSPDVYDSPPSYDTPGSTDSEGSMCNHGENATPPESPAKPDSPGPDVGGLSLGDHSRKTSPVGRRGRGCPSTAPSPASKRSASSELPRPPGKQPAGVTQQRNAHTAGLRDTKTVASAQRQRRGHPGRQLELQKAVGCGVRPAIIGGGARGNLNHHYEHGKKLQHPVPQDSGYETLGSRANTLQYAQPHVGGTLCNTLPLSDSTPPVLDGSQKGRVTHRSTAIEEHPASGHYPGLILQPDSSPISTDQLAAEVKGIYAGLVMVEAKCINIDAAQAADPTTQLGQEQWQALIALHRTLLYEHHDFLMATQHPSATPALRGLATKYSMPARMWKHGIHAFLEVLRHRRPDSQDYMLAFIYLAYQMMALLFETVPSFLDTWIECLGDLARYRMAIEEEKEPHAQWGGVAASWYTKAADRHPQIGRLYHHLGILERPSLRKFACYSKSLTCVVPFPNARDSMATLCNPIVEEGEAARTTVHSTEASLCKVHALIFLQRDQQAIDQAMSTAFALLDKPESLRWKDCGVPLAVTNISALLGHGSSTNTLRNGYDLIITQSIQRGRPSYAGPMASAPTHASAVGPTKSEHLGNDRLLSAAKATTLFTFHSALRCRADSNSIRDVLPFIHVMTCFLHSMHLVEQHNTSGLLHAFDGVSWNSLASFLNELMRLEPLAQRVLQSARSGVWLVSEQGNGKPLPEDYAIRGLVWTYFSFGPAWFDVEQDEYGRTIETPSTHKARAERTMYYGLRLAFESKYMNFEEQSQTFSAASGDIAGPGIHQATSVRTTRPTVTSERSVATPPALPSAPVSSASDSDFVHVSPPGPKRSPKAGAGQTQKPPRTWASVASARKPVNHTASVQIADPDAMEWRR